MTTVTICIEAEFPTYSNLFEMFKEQLMKLFDPNFQFPDPNFKYPPFKINFPDTLTIKKTMFGDTFFSPTMFIAKYVNALVQEFLFILIGAILDALEPILGAIPIPTIPCLGVDLFDILAGNLGSIEEGCSCGPKVATNVDSPSMKAPTNIADCITGYLKTLVDLVIGLVQDLIDYIEDLQLTPPGVPSFPTIPTKADLLAMIPTVTFPPVPGFTVGGVTVPDLEIPPAPTLDSLLSISIPGIDVSALIPNPILEFSKPGSFEIEEAINAVLHKLTILPLELLVTFINECLGILGLDGIPLPTLCFSFPVEEA